MTVFFLLIQVILFKYSLAQYTDKYFDHSFFYQ